MSYSVYTWRIAYAVTDPKHWEKAINFLNMRIRPQKSDSNQFNIYKVLKGYFEEALINKQTVFLHEIRVNDNNMRPPKYVDIDIPMKNFDPFSDMYRWLSAEGKTAGFFGFEIWMSSAEPASFASYYMGEDNEYCKRVNSMSQNWNSFKEVIDSCNIRLTKSRLEFLKDFPDSEFDFIRSRYREYDVFDDIKEFCSNPQDIVINGKKLFFNFENNVEKISREVEEEGGLIQKAITDNTDYIIIENDFDRSLIFLTAEMMNRYKAMKNGSSMRFIIRGDLHKGLARLKRQKQLEEKKPDVNQEVAKIISAYDNSPQKPSSVKQIREEHSEIDFKLLDSYFSKIYNKSLSQFLHEKGILEEKELISNNSSHYIDFDSLLNKLQEKYHDPVSRKKTVKSLIEDNPELKTELSQLQRNSLKLYGKSMSLLLIDNKILKNIDV